MKSKTFLPKSHTLPLILCESVQTLNITGAISSTNSCPVFEKKRKNKHTIKLLLLTSLVLTNQAMSPKEASSPFTKQAISLFFQRL